MSWILILQWNGSAEGAVKLRRYIMGWVNYLKIADEETAPKEMNG